jgi:predicted alpha/beta superfamily hydrolase
MMSNALPTIPNPVATYPLIKQAVRSHKISMQECSFSGRAFRIYMAMPTVPEGKPTRIAYLLDGNAAFGALTPSMLEGQRDLAIVAIGYPTDNEFDFDARSRDYTPMPHNDWDGGSRQALRRPFGGADTFLKILTGPMREHIEHMIGASVGHRSLWGHSYGGLFALFAASKRPDAFDDFHIASPSLWWDDGRIAQALEWSSGGSRPCLTFYTGTQEKPSLPGAGNGSALDALIADLRTRHKRSVSWVKLNAGHRQMLDASLFRTLGVTGAQAEQFQT